MGLGDNLEPTADHTLTWPPAAPGAFTETMQGPKSHLHIHARAVPTTQPLLSEGSPWAAERFGKQGIGGRLSPE